MCLGVKKGPFFPMSKAIVSALVSCVKCHHVFSPRRFEGHSCKSIGLTGEFKGK